MISEAIFCCLVEICWGNSLNHANKSVMSKAESSAIFLLAILKYNASLRRRVPWQCSQGTLSINSSAQRLIAVISVFSCWLLIKLIIPSKSISKLRVSPITSDFTAYLSLPPCRIISIASLGSLSIGSESLCPNFWTMSSNCLKIQVFFCSPMATIPPFLIDSDGSGIILARLISCTSPKPLQCGHIPLGELKERVLGSGIG